MDGGVEIRGDEFSDLTAYLSTLPPSAWQSLWSAERVFLCVRTAWQIHSHRSDARRCGCMYGLKIRGEKRRRRCHHTAVVECFVRVTLARGSLHGGLSVPRTSEYGRVLDDVGQIDRTGQISEERLTLRSMVKGSAYFRGATDSRLTFLMSPRPRCRRPANLNCSAFLPGIEGRAMPSSFWPRTHLS